MAPLWLAVLFAVCGVGAAMAVLWRLSVDTTLAGWCLVAWLGCECALVCGAYRMMRPLWGPGEEPGFMYQSCFWLLAVGLYDVPNLIVATATVLLLRGVPPVEFPM